MKLRILLPLLVAAAVVYLLAWPVPIDPAAWEPPEAPSIESGVHASNSHLAAVTRIAEGVGVGPEAISIDDEGHLLTGFIDGRVMRFDADGGNGELLANTGGRPLGLHALTDGSVIVADAMEGLVRIDDGYAYTLSVSAEGVPYRFVDDVVVGADERMVYFTDASSRFGYHEVMADAFEHRPHGRIIAYDLKTDEVRVLAEDLYFANGITLGPDDEYLVFTETTRYRVQRLWLEGERAGETEVLVDNLPGFPDNITFNGEDRFWLALYSPRDPALDKLLARPFLRKMAFRLPEAIQPGPATHGYVLALDVDGGVLADLQHVGEGAYAPITSAVEYEGTLYLGSLSAPAIGRVSLEALPLDGEAGVEASDDEASAADSNGNNDSE